MSITTLRQYRAGQEEALRTELAELQRAVDDAEVIRIRLEETTLENVKTYLERAKEGLTADEALLWNDLMERMADSVSRATDAVAKARRRLEEKRLEAVEAARETRKLEILERRESDRTQRLDDVRTQRQLDEVGGRRFQSRRKEHHDGPERN